MVKELAALPANRTYLTTWQQLVNTWGLNQALGWNDPYLELDGFGMGDYDWEKEIALFKWQQQHPDQPFIWIDDDEWIETNTDRIRALPVPKLLLRTQHWIGITPEHIEEMRQFCQEISSPALKL
jgi:hypothetical protein